jgi:hypothetical protein
VPPGYGFSNWLREPFFVKWHVLNMLPVVRFLPFVFALCVAGMLQVAGLQLQVKFRVGLLIFLIQWVATVVGMFVLLFVFNLLLGLGGQTLNYALAGATEAKPAPDQPGAPAPPPDTHKPIADSHPIAVKHEIDQAVHYGENLKAQLDPHLEEVKESARSYLPQSVQHWLDQGHRWWWLFGVLGVIALCWLLSVWRRLTGVFFKPKKKKKKKRRTKVTPVDLSEDISPLAMVYTELGEKQITIKGLPARLRLVVLAAASRDVGELHEEMADRLLDWIKPGLAEVAAYDVPRVRIWPPQYSLQGFGLIFAQNVAIPEPKGERSHWVLVSGLVTISKQPIHVGLAFYTDEPNSLRHVQVGNERWLDVIGVKAIHTRVGV